MYCDDDTILRGRVGATRARVRDGKFEFARYASSAEAQSFLLVRGEIAGPRVALGRVMLGLDASEPGPDCGTKGQGRWSATSRSSR
jgi:hypothetical protein